jgi:hypothetical protein
LGDVSLRELEALGIFEVFRGRKDENAAIFAVLESTSKTMAATV